MPHLQESSWNALVPGNSLETSTTRRYSLQIRGCSCIYINYVYEGLLRKDKQCLWLSISRMHATESSSDCWWKIWCQAKADPADCRGAPGKNSGYANWKLELYSSLAHNGPTTRTTTLTDPIQCIHQGPGRSQSNWTQQGTHTIIWRVHTQNIEGQPGGSQSGAATTG